MLAEARPERTTSSSATMPVPISMPGASVVPQPSVVGDPSARADGIGTSGRSARQSAAGPDAWAGSGAGLYSKCWSKIVTGAHQMCPLTRQAPDMTSAASLTKRCAPLSQTLLWFTAGPARKARLVGIVEPAPKAVRRLCAASFAASPASSAPPVTEVQQRKYEMCVARLQGRAMLEDAPANLSSSLLGYTC